MEQEGQEEEEVEDIVVEFEGNFDLESVKDKQVQLLGVDKDQPILRIDSKFYKMETKHSIGTRLILKHDQDDKKLKYHGKTDKVVTAKLIMIKPKET